MYIPGTRVWISYLEAQRVDAAGTPVNIAVEAARRPQIAKKKHTQAKLYKKLKNKKTETKFANNPNRTNDNNS